MPKPKKRSTHKQQLNYALKPIWYLGIDPGSNGGVAAITDRSSVRFPSTHTTEWFTGMNSRNDLAEFLRSFALNSRFAVVELNNSSPQMGVVSAMTFGRNCEQPSAMLSALSIPYEEVRPQEWQRYLQIPPRRKAIISRKKTKGKDARRCRVGETDTQWKDRLRAKAQQMFPGIDLWQQNKTIQRAVCDALLIAEYCRRIYSGESR